MTKIVKKRLSLLIFCSFFAIFAQGENDYTSWLESIDDNTHSISDVLSDFYTSWDNEELNRLSNYVHTAEINDYLKSYLPVLSNVISNISTGNIDLTNLTDVVTTIATNQLVHDMRLQNVVSDTLVPQYNDIHDSIKGNVQTSKDKLHNIDALLDYYLRTSGNSNNNQVLQNLLVALTGTHDPLNASSSWYSDNILSNVRGLSSATNILSDIRTFLLTNDFGSVSFPSNDYTTVLNSISSTIDSLNDVLSDFYNDYGEDFKTLTSSLGSVSNSVLQVGDNITNNLYDLLTVSHSNTNLLTQILTNLHDRVWDVNITNLVDYTDILSSIDRSSANTLTNLTDFADDFSQFSDISTNLVSSGFASVTNISYQTLVSLTNGFVDVNNNLVTITNSLRHADDFYGFWAGDDNYSLPQPTPYGTELYSINPSLGSQTFVYRPSANLANPRSRSVSLLRSVEYLQQDTGSINNYLFAQWLYNSTNRVASNLQYLSDYFRTNGLSVVVTNNISLTNAVTVSIDDLEINWDDYFRRMHDDFLVDFDVWATEFLQQQGKEFVEDYFYPSFDSISNNQLLTLSALTNGFDLANFNLSVISNQLRRADNFFSLWTTNVNFNIPTVNHVAKLIGFTDDGVILPNNDAVFGTVPKPQNAFQALLYELSYIQRGALSLNNYSWLDWQYRLTNNVPANLQYLADYYRTNYLNNATLQYILNPSSYSRSAYTTPMYYYKGYTGRPSLVTNSSLNPDLGGLSRLLFSFFPNLIGSIDNYLYDYYTNGIKVSNLSEIDTQISVTNNVEFSYTNLVNVVVTNSFDLSFTNLITSLDANVSNFVRHVLDIDFTSPLVDLGNSDDIHAYCTNYYLQVATGSASSSMSHTNWFNRVELLLAAMVFGDGKSTNVVDNSEADTVGGQFANVVRDINSSTGISSTLDTLRRSELSFYSVLSSFGHVFDGVGLPTDGINFEVVTDGDSVSFYSDLDSSDTRFFGFVRAVTGFLWMALYIMSILWFLRLVLRIGVSLVSSIWRLVDFRKTA